MAEAKRFKLVPIEEVDRAWAKKHDLLEDQVEGLDLSDPPQLEDECDWEDYRDTYEERESRRQQERALQRLLQFLRQEKSAVLGSLREELRFPVFPATYVIRLDNPPHKEILEAWAANWHLPYTELLVGNILSTLRMWDMTEDFEKLTDSELRWHFEEEYDLGGDSLMRGGAPRFVFECDWPRELRLDRAREKVNSEFQKALAKRVNSEKAEFFRTYPFSCLPPLAAPKAPSEETILTGKEIEYLRLLAKKLANPSRTHEDFGDPNIGGKKRSVSTVSRSLKAAATLVGLAWEDIPRAPHHNRWTK